LQGTPHALDLQRVVVDVEHTHRIWPAPRTQGPLAQGQDFVRRFDGGHGAPIRISAVVFVTSITTALNVRYGALGGRLVCFAAFAPRVQDASQRQTYVLR